MHHILLQPRKVICHNIAPVRLLPITKDMQSPYQQEALKSEVQDSDRLRYLIELYAIKALL